MDSLLAVAGDILPPCWLVLHTQKCSKAKQNSLTPLATAMNVPTTTTHKQVAKVKEAFSRKTQQQAQPNTKAQCQ